ASNVGARELPLIDQRRAGCFICQREGAAEWHTNAGRWGNFYSRAASDKGPIRAESEIIHDHQIGGTRGAVFNHERGDAGSFVGIHTEDTERFGGNVKATEVVGGGVNP